MNRLLYFVKKALGGMRAAPFVHAVAALTIAVALLLAGVVGALALQARSLLDEWGLRAEITVYLAPRVQPADAEYLAKQAAEITSGTARYVTAQEAMARLAEALGEEGEALRELPENPLPPSVEVVPAVGTTAEQVEVLARALRKLDGVIEVDYGRAWIERITGLSRAAGVIGLTLLPLILLGAAVLAASVVRLAIHARASEIDIQRLVGATNAFVRAPFLVEGALAGLAGGLLGAAGLFAVASYVGPTLQAAVPLPPELQPVALAGPLPLLVVVGAGVLLGFVASAISVGRHLR
ncbi:cell division protein FtsX [Vulgatibacter sp.]|uniref:cell division protein FtsX n=1 Tax=Vulgatibacter sp. TaxID=1971226 RepID=UPI0035617E94